MKKIIYVILWNFYSLYAFADLKDDMMPNSETIWVTWEWSEPLTNVILYIKDFIFSILWLITIGVFLYFWFKLVTSRWEEEEFKKTLMWFLYVVIWLAIIPLALWAVKIISSLKF